MKTKIQNHLGVSWNTEDLISCKWACEILIFKGIDLNVLKALNFGALDVDSVFKECFA